MSLREKKSFFGKLSERLSDVINARSVVDEELFDELEEILITSDIGMDTTMRIIEELRGRVKDAHITKPEVVKIMLKKIIVRFIDKEDRQKLSNETPLVILVIGVNGGGKTTTIGKIATRLKNEGKSVMLAAADTFRAAAAEQLSMGRARRRSRCKARRGSRPVSRYIRRCGISKGKKHRCSYMRYGRQTSEQKKSYERA